MNDAELTKRKTELLRGRKLKDEIDKLIGRKGFNASCTSVTTFAGEHGADWIAIELLVDAEGTKYIPKVVIYIPEDIYYEDRFSVIDSWIPGRLSMEDRILLRALRIAFNVIKTVSVGPEARGASPDRIIYAKANEDGFISYYN